MTVPPMLQTIFPGQQAGTGTTSALQRAFDSSAATRPRLPFPYAATIPCADRGANMRRREFLGAIGGMVLGWPLQAQAQSAQQWPDRPVRLLVTVGAGGAGDKPSG